jgi:hypothetical protein
MNTKRIHEILAATSQQFRKGAEGVTELATNERPINVTHIYMMPAEDEAPAGLEMIDVHFIKVGVDKAAAEEHRAELLGLLEQYEPRDELAGGPSYMHVGGRIGDQGAALQLFAVGKVMGLWDVITPATMGFKGAEADHMAGSGFVMCTGIPVKKRAA